jgi:ribonuclease HII
MDKTLKNIRYIVGIDEVGRGPIAGPVAVCSFICLPEFFNNTDIGLPLRDSKKLSASQRERWFAYLKKCKENSLCNYMVSYVSSEMIDRHGIVPAIKKALETSLLKIATEPENVFVYLDGGLKAPAQFTYQETVIKGDEIHKVISCASIIAKVSRDRVMTLHAKEYPEYGFEKHAGYGTKAHYDAIRKYGATVLHRKSFL